MADASKLESEETDLLCCLAVVAGRNRRLEALLPRLEAELPQLEAEAEKAASAPPEAPRNGCGLLLTVEQVLSWADAHKERIGRYPAIASGSIPEAAGPQLALP